MSEREIVKEVARDFRREREAEAASAAASRSAVVEDLGRKLRCRHCGQVNLLPVVAQPAPVGPDEVERIRADAIDRFIAELTANAKDPARIGLRVLHAKYARQDPAARPELRNHAKALGIGSAAASASVSSAAQTIKQLIKTNAPVPSLAGTRESEA